MLINKLNDNEKQFVKMLDDAWKYVKGELELDNFEGKWYAMDYRAEFECAFHIEAKPYDDPLITDEEAKENCIDIEKCCDYCNAYIVG